MQTATAKPGQDSRPGKWLTRALWLGFVLIWNGVGGLLALYAILAVILNRYYSIGITEPPAWLVPTFFWLWFLPMPFTTCGAVIFLWRRRTTVGAKWLLLYALVIFALWSILTAMLVAFFLFLGR